MKLCPSKSVINLLLLSFLIVSHDVTSGALSKTTKHGINVVSDALKTGKYTPKTRDSVRLVKFANKYGDNGVRTIRAVAEKNKVHEDKVLLIFNRYPNRVKVLLQTGSQIDSNVLSYLVRHRKHKGAEWLIKHHPDEVMRYKLHNEKADNIVKEVWRLVDNNAVGGSFKDLQKAFSDAGVEYNQARNLVESLLPKLVKSGKIKGIRKGANIYPAQYNNIHGIDYIYVKDGKLTFVEFSTGKKPVTSNVRQMTPEWIRENWVKYLENTDAKTLANLKVNLRNDGVPQEMLSIKNLKNPKFNIMKHSKRQYIAPEIDNSLMYKHHGYLNDIVVSEQN